MDKEAITEYGVVGILVLLILKEVFAFIVAKKNGVHAHPNGSLCMMVKEIWEWHKPDDTGVQMWRNHGVVDCLKKMEETLIRIEIVLGKWIVASKKSEEVHSRMERKLDVIEEKQNKIIRIE